jgi:hypothetical protein
VLLHNSSPRSAVATWSAATCQRGKEVLEREGRERERGGRERNNTSSRSPLHRWTAPPPPDPAHPRSDGASATGSGASMAVRHLRHRISCLRRRTAHPRPEPAPSRPDGTADVGRCIRLRIQHLRGRTAPAHAANGVRRVVRPLSVRADDGR